MNGPIVRYVSLCARLDVLASEAKDRCDFGSKWIDFMPVDVSVAMRHKQSVNRDEQCGRRIPHFGGQPL